MINQVPEMYVHGLDGVNHHVVILSGRVCAKLERLAQLHTIRVDQRGIDPEFDAMLGAMRIAALAWRDSATGTKTVPLPEAETRLRWFSTTEVADRLNVTDRAIRQAITDGRLPARKLDGHWRIGREDFEQFKAARRAA